MSPSPDEATAWLTEAMELPLRFAQVREDPLQDIQVVREFGGAAEVMMIASGGCTAAALAGVGCVTHLHLVDPNAAQIALARMKLRLLQTCPVGDRFALLGHTAMDAASREHRILRELGALELCPDILGPIESVALLGPDHAGRYERLFAAFRKTLAPFASELDAVLEMRDRIEQVRRVGADTALGQALDRAFDDVMALPNLVQLFGAEATKNPLKSFSRHFAQRVRHALATFEAAENPYLWQMLRGAYPPGAAAPWLSMAAPERMPEISWVRGFMDEALDSAAPERFHFVHLSNVLDWLSLEEARRTLERAWRVLRPGGVVLIRQLNSSLEIPALESRFAWDASEAERLHANDRSFFYRQLHLGRKR